MLWTAQEPFLGGCKIALSCGKAGRQRLPAFRQVRGRGHAAQHRPLPRPVCPERCGSSGGGCPPARRLQKQALPCGRRQLFRTCRMAVHNGCAAPESILCAGSPCCARRRGIFLNAGRAVSCKPAGRRPAGGGDNLQEERPPPFGKAVSDLLTGTRSERATPWLQALPEGAFRPAQAGFV